MKCLYCNAQDVFSIENHLYTEGAFFHCKCYDNYLKYKLTTLEIYEKNKEEYELLKSNLSKSNISLFSVSSSLETLLPRYGTLFLANFVEYFYLYKKQVFNEYGLYLIKNEISNTEQYIKNKTAIKQSSSLSLENKKVIHISPPKVERKELIALDTIDLT